MTLALHVRNNGATILFVTLIGFKILAKERFEFNCAKI